MRYPNDGDAMELMDKLEILANGAKYDVSCVSSGSSRKNTGGIGSGLRPAYATFTGDSRCVSLLRYCCQTSAYTIAPIA